MMAFELIQCVRVLTSGSGWDAIVESMHDAFADPKHIIILGIALAIGIVLYVNYRVAKWLEDQAEHYHEHHPHQHTHHEHHEHRSHE